MIFSIAGSSFAIEASDAILQQIIPLWRCYLLPDDVQADYHINIFRNDIFDTQNTRDTQFLFQPDGMKIPVAINQNGNLLNIYIPEKSAVICSLNYACTIALSERCLGVHGVAAIVGDKFILFSARSGVGKTTFTGVLHRECGAAIVNGDYAFLSVQDDGKVMFEPSPFCGSSGICKKHRLSLDNIVFLERGEPYAWRDLNAREACGRLFDNCFIPAFDPARKTQSMNLALSIVQNVPMCSYTFLSNREAALKFVKELNG